MYDAPAIRLPQTLSDLAELGIADLRRTELDPRYRIDMLEWHLPDGATCAVCLAGAVMAQTLSAPVDLEWTPGYADAATNEKALRALESLRKGSVRHAADLLDTEAAVPDRPIRDYATDRAGFFADIERLIRELRHAGQ